MNSKLEVNWALIGIFTYWCKLITLRSRFPFKNYFSFEMSNFPNVFVPEYAERNLNPKAACLKRREEEKAEDGPKLPQHHMLSNAYPAMPVSNISFDFWMHQGHFSLSNVSAAKHAQLKLMRRWRNKAKISFYSMNWERERVSARERGNRVRDKWREMLEWGEEKRCIRQIEEKRRYRMIRERGKNERTTRISQLIETFQINNKLLTGIIALFFVIQI